MHVVGVSTTKCFDELTDLENKKMQYDCVAKNIITFALNLDGSLEYLNAVQPKKCRTF